MKPSPFTVVLPIPTNFASASSESRALEQVFLELQLTRRKLAEMLAERSQLLARIEILEHNGRQASGNALENSYSEQDFSTENIAFTNEGGPPVDQG